MEPVATVEDNSRTPYIEEQIKELQNHTIQFIELLNEYIRKRNWLDPKFNCDELDLTDPDEDTSFDIYGETITIQWREYDQCGESDYFSESFPLRHLWSMDWDQMEIEWKSEQRKKREAEEARKVAAEAKKKQAQEQRERAELERLQSKYGGAK